MEQLRRDVKSNVDMLYDTYILYRRLRGCFHHPGAADITWSSKSALSNPVNRILRKYHVTTSPNTATTAATTSTTDCDV